MCELSKRITRTMYVKRFSRQIGFPPFPLITSKCSLIQRCTQQSVSISVTYYDTQLYVNAGNSRVIKHSLMPSVNTGNDQHAGCARNRYNYLKFSLINRCFAIVISAYLKLQTSNFQVSLNKISLRYKETSSKE